MTFTVRVGQTVTVHQWNNGDLSCHRFRREIRLAQMTLVPTGRTAEVVSTVHSTGPNVLWACRVSLREWQRLRVSVIHSSVPSLGENAPQGFCGTR